MTIRAEDQLQDHAVAGRASLARLYVAGNVRRFHQSPALSRIASNNADHQGRCVQLLLALCPDAGGALIRAVAFHDVGELIAGDLSYLFKRANPEIAAAHAKAEHAARDAITGVVPHLTKREAQWLSLVDKLEAHCWCLLHDPREYDRPGSGFLESEPFILAEAALLGCAPRVRGLLHDLKGGRW